MTKPEEQRAAFQKALKENKYDLVTHRAFSDWLEEQGEDDLALHHRLWTAEWQMAEDRLKAFCKQVDLNFSYFVKMARKHLEDGSDIPVTIDTSNLTMDRDLVMAMGAEPGEELVDLSAVWRDAGVYLRMGVEEGRKTDPFTCGSDCFPEGLSWEDGEE